MLQTFEMNIFAGGSLGLRLSRSPWDPYPWISSIQKQSCSDKVGLCVGDTVLELNGYDILGLKISEIAQILKKSDDCTAESASDNCNIISNNNSNKKVTLLVWRNKSFRNKSNNNKYDEQENKSTEEIHNKHNFNQQSLQKFATCLQRIAQLLECPICLNIIKPPGWQCCNGHVLCNNCRSRSMKCPVCRVLLGPRGRCLLSDKLYHLLDESFPCDSVLRKSSNINN